jgi:hypothetical protein
MFVSPYFTYLRHYQCGPGSSVGIATGYGLDGPDRIPVGARFFAHVQTGPGAHPASCTMVPGLSRGLNCRGVVLTLTPFYRRGLKTE